jgi:hypothetical protein
MDAALAQNIYKNQPISLSMETNEKILSIVKARGPLLPVQVAKEINDNILMTSARLSELLTSRQIKISSVKVGGSPLYYFQGQESKLQDFAGNLQQKEKEAYELLKQNRILRDTSQEPAIRVALRQIKDFAVPLQVNYEAKAEIFWKWYLTDSNETQLIIRKLLDKKNIIESAHKPEAIKGTIDEKETAIKNEAQKELRKDITKKARKADKDEFLNGVQQFLNKNKINILERKEIKKHQELDFILELPTTIGRVKYFCKAKGRKKINESDLSTAFVNAQSKNLPLLFLTTGSLTKKAKEMLNNEFKNVILKEL